MKIEITIHNEEGEQVLHTEKPTVDMAVQELYRFERHSKKFIQGEEV